jgi:hypothetical protein
MVKVRFKYRKETENYHGETQPEIPPSAVTQSGREKHACQKRHHRITGHYKIEMKSDHIGEKQIGYGNIRDQTEISHQKQCAAYSKQQQKYRAAA